MLAKSIIPIFETRIGMVIFHYRHLSKCKNNVKQRKYGLL